MIVAINHKFAIVCFYNNRGIVIISNSGAVIAAQSAILHHFFRCFCVDAPYVSYTVQYLVKIKCCYDLKVIGTHRKKYPSTYVIRIVK